MKPLESAVGKTTRRRHLQVIAQTAAGALLSAAGAGAFGQAQVAVSDDDSLDDYDFHIARVRFDCQAGSGGARWNVYPGGDKYLLEEYQTVVRSKVKIPTGSNGQVPVHGDDSCFNAVVALEDGIESLRPHPFLFMTGEGNFTFSRAQKESLRSYIDEGGFLLIDDCVLAPSGDFLYQSSRRMLEEVFGAGSLVRVSNDHEVFHNVYDLGAIGLPHLQGQNHGARGVFVDGRLAVFLSSTDIHCGWVDRRGTWFPNPALGRHGYAEAIQMGINILMYATSH